MRRRRIRTSSLAPHEAEGNPINALGEAEFEVFDVLVRKRRQAEVEIGKIHALAALEHPTLDDLTPHGIARNFDDFHLEETISQRICMPGLASSATRIVDGDGGGLAKQLSLRHEGHDVTGIELDLTFRKYLPGPGSLEILEDGHRRIELRRNGPQMTDYRAVILVGTVGEIQPGYIHASQNQLGTDLGRVADRTDGGYDLGTAQCRVRRVHQTIFARTIAFLALSARGLCRHGVTKKRRYIDLRGQDRSILDWTTRGIV